MVPAEATRAILREEMVAARAWARRHGWQVECDEEALLVMVRMTHLADQKPLLLRAECAGYRALPPLWQFLDPVTGQPSRQANPSPASGSSFFQNDGYICAHWNRGAYAEHGGPHGNWGSSVGWATVKDGIQAHNIAEMLSAVFIHLRQSPGRLS